MIRIELQHDEATRAALGRLAGLMDDLTPVMRDIGEYLVAATRARFVAGQGPDGAAWAPKRESTIAAALARGDRTDPRPLVGPSRRLGREIHYRASPRGVEVGSSLVYAAAQQFGAARGQFGRDARGAPIPWGDIPARPFLGLDDTDRAAIADIIAEAIARAAGA